MDELDRLEFERDMELFLDMYAEQAPERYVALAESMMAMDEAPDTTEGSK